jgi:hypothetical protein
MILVNTGFWLALANQKTGITRLQSAPSPKSKRTWSPLGQ